MSHETTTPDPPAVLTERRDRVLVITLNRPEAMNAINGPLSHGLWAAVGELNADPELTAGVLTGAGKGFCSGMDLKAFARGEDIGPMLEYVRKGADKPLIGAIEGFALAGGLELALACDLLVAAEGAKLGIPEVGVGLFAALRPLPIFPFGSFQNTLDARYERFGHGQQNRFHGVLSQLKQACQGAVHGRPRGVWDREGLSVRFCNAKLQFWVPVPVFFTYPCHSIGRQHS